MSVDIRGHLWTLKPYVGYGLKPLAPPPSREWRTEVVDPKLGPIRLSGRLASHGKHRAIVVIVHGLGGSASSYYAHLAALAAERAGLASLRLNLRGADRRGEDLYHAGLFSDLGATMSSHALRGYEAIYLLGYSLGGHVVLRFLAEQPDERIRGAAVICAPVDLGASVAEIDQPAQLAYRRHILRGLKEMYREVATKRPLPLTADEVQRIGTIYEWDEHVIAPRHGFDGAMDYYERESAWSRLTQIRTPTLFVSAEHDPMVRIDTVRPRLVNTRWLTPRITDRGGHVGFPPGLDLDLGMTGPIEDQAIGWMMAAT